MARPGDRTARLQAACKTPEPRRVGARVSSGCSLDVGSSLCGGRKERRVHGDRRVCLHCRRAAWLRGAPCGSSSWKGVPVGRGNMALVMHASPPPLSVSLRSVTCTRARPTSSGSVRSTPAGWAGRRRRPSQCWWRPGQVTCSRRAAGRVCALGALSLKFPSNTQVSGLLSFSQPLYFPLSVSFSYVC